MTKQGRLFQPLKLPCGVHLKNRLAKSAMSDSLGDGTGHPTAEQMTLYRRWAEGGVGLSIIGEVQGSADYAEKPGNLVLNEASDISQFAELARQGSRCSTRLWLQLGHAGALAHAATSTPRGPSALDLPGLCCAELTRDEIECLPSVFARTAGLAKAAGFGGVQIHAAHGFVLSQFLSPLFNRRKDAYGGSIANRMRIVLEVIKATRAVVGANFPIAVKLNSTDKIEGGLSEADALAVVQALDGSSLDLIDISGGTYFPGAPSASDGALVKGPYFLEFAKRARQFTAIPLMLTGGFKTQAQAEAAIVSGAVDVVGLARALALEPALPELWRTGQMQAPSFPKFSDAPPGGITAWYTMRLTEIGIGSKAMTGAAGVGQALSDYEARDRMRAGIWQRHFGVRGQV